MSNTYSELALFCISKEVEEKMHVKKRMLVKSINEGIMFLLQSKIYNCTLTKNYQLPMIQEILHCTLLLYQFSGTSSTSSEIYNESGTFLIKFNKEAVVVISNSVCQI